MKRFQNKQFPIGDPPPSIIKRTFWALSGRCRKCGGEFKVSRVSVCEGCGYRRVNNSRLTNYSRPR